MRSLAIHRVRNTNLSRVLIIAALLAFNADSTGAAEMHGARVSAVKEEGSQRPRGAAPKQKNAGEAKKTTLSDKLVLTLSLTLTPPKNVPVQPTIPTPAKPGIPSTVISRPVTPSPVTPMERADAAQHDATTRAQRLKELNVQIAEMERTIKAQQNQLDVLPNSPAPTVVIPVPAPVAVTPVPVVLVPASAELMKNPVVEVPGSVGVSGVASVPLTGAVQPKSAANVRIVNPAKTAKPGLVELLEENGLYLAIGFVVSLFAVFGFVGYRRHKTGPRDDLDQSQDLSVESEQPEPPPQQVVAKTPLAEVGSLTMKAPAYIAQPKPQSILPPEYEMLEEADIYLRFGHDKLAEEALKEAIKINPKNPQAYLTLLRIYFSREDSAAFVTVAQQLKLLGDESVWPRVVEMGRNLDPNNILYN